MDEIQLREAIAAVQRSWQAKARTIMGLLNDAALSQDMDEALRRRGFERGYLNGGPPMEPSFREALERGVRWYMAPTNAHAVIVSKRGTFHVKDDEGHTTHRGHGVGQLVRALAALRKESD